MYPLTSYRKYWPRYKNGNPIWNFFDISDEHSSYPRCKECDKEVCRGFTAKNTSNMRRHLQFNHPNLYEELLELCEREKHPPAPVIAKVEDVPVIDSESENEGDEDDFFDATDEFEDVQEKFNAEADVTSTALAIYIPPTSINNFNNQGSNICSVQESITTNIPHSNDNENSQTTNSTNPNMSMSEEELRKQLLIAQIEKEKAQTGYFQACTLAVHSRVASQ